MEAHKKMSKPLKKKSEKHFSEKRSPLQNLNTLNFHKSITKNTSNFTSSSSSFSSASSSTEARNGCLRLLRSSNSSSDISLPPSSSRKPKSLPKVAAANVSAKSVRSKENELPKKKQQWGIRRRENVESKTNPMFRTAERSKLPSGRGNPVKISEAKKLNFCTPMGSSGVRRNAAEDSSSRKPNNGSAGSAKTPPIEASLSPEIQSKTVVLNSAATPVCYGAGHLLSGVTDKRKCRRRGSLRGGCEKMTPFDDEKSVQNLADDLQDCLVPLPSEASVRWLLSPCDEGREERESDAEMKVEECELSCGNASLELDLLSSLSMLYGNISELDHDVVKGQCLLGNLDEKMCDSFIVETPNSVSNISVGLGEGKGMSEKNSAVSIASLSSGNIIQTPDSDMSSYAHRSSVSFELGSINETLDAETLSSRNKISIKDEENVESVCSWMSSYTSLSQMRISWRDGLDRRIDEDDELDCCPCLSDNSDQHLKPYKLSQSVGDRVPTIEFPDKDVSPILLEYEPCIAAVPKEIWPGARRNACAESICTNGGDLAVSCDSDWTNIEESRSFQVK